MDQTTRYVPRSSCWADVDTASPDVNTMAALEGKEEYLQAEGGCLQLSPVAPRGMLFLIQSDLPVEASNMEEGTCLLAQERHFFVTTYLQEGNRAHLIS